MMLIMRVIYVDFVFGLLRRGQEEIDVLPVLNKCDSMSKMFKEHPNKFIKTAEKDYLILNETFGDNFWDLVDDNVEFDIKQIRGSLFCFCWVVDKSVKVD